MKRLVYAFLLMSSTSTVFSKPTLPAKEAPSAALTSEIRVSIPELRKIQSKLQSYKYLTVDFEQKIYKSLRKKNLTNKGEVLFKKPSSFRWKFRHPEQEEWVFDGETLLHYFPKKSYAHRYSAKASKGKNLREIVNIVLDFDSLLERYTIISSGKEKDLIHIGMVPKDSNEIAKVEIILDLGKNFMKRVKLLFEGGNHSTFLFSNPRFNEIKDTFGVAAGVKVTDAI